MSKNSFLLEETNSSLLNKLEEEQTEVASLALRLPSLLPLPQPSNHLVEVKTFDCCRGSLSAGTLSFNTLSRILKLEVQPDTLLGLLYKHRLHISLKQPEGERHNFADSLVQINGISLYFAEHAPLPLDEIKTICIWLDDEPPASRVAAFVPPPPFNPLIELEELPHLFGKPCLVYYREEAHGLRTFSDVLHSYSGGFVHFLNRVSIPLQDLRHISPLETIQKNSPESSGLPLWDSEPISRSIP